SKRDWSSDVCSSDLAFVSYDRAEENGDPTDAEPEHDGQCGSSEGGAGAGSHSEAHQETDGKQNGYGDDVADDVGEDRSKQRRGAGDGEAAEAVEDALLHVNVQRHAGGHHPGQTCAGDDDAGKDILDVVTGGAGDGAAEQ